MAEWLAPRGLVFNEDKTRIVHLDEGFDYLGFNVRRYRGGKLLITPSADAVRRIRKRLADEMRSLRGSNAMAVIARLNPIIRGWAAYYRGVVSSKVFAALDNYLWQLTYKGAKHSHPAAAGGAARPRGRRAALRRGPEGAAHLQPGRTRPATQQGLQQNTSGRLTSEQRTKDRYRIRGYLSTASKHGHNMIDVLRDAILGRPWTPPHPAPT